jgi:hypothetical protein
MAVLTLVAPINGPVTQVSSLTYASPKPMSTKELDERARQLR